MDRKLVTASRAFLNSSFELLFRFWRGSVILEFISHSRLYLTFLSYLCLPCHGLLPAHYIPLGFFSFWMNDLQIAILLYFLRIYFYDHPLRHLWFFGDITRVQIAVYCRKFHRNSRGFCGNKFQIETCYGPKGGKMPEWEAPGSLTHHLIASWWCLSCYLWHPRVFQHTYSKGA